MHSPRSPGFTLMELLVVMAVIAVIATLAIPAFDHSMESGRVTKCLSNLRQLGAGLSGYLAEHDGAMPTMEIGRKSIEEKIDALDTILAPHISVKEVFACPSDKEKRLAELTGTSYFWNSSLNGQRIGGLNFLKLTEDRSRIPVMGDKEGFHPYIKTKVNILYADGHVSKELSFKTD